MRSRYSYVATQAESDSELSPDKFRLLPVNQAYLREKFPEDVYGLLALNGFPPVSFSKIRRIHGPYPHAVARVSTYSGKRTNKVVRYDSSRMRAFIQAFLTVDIIDPMVVAVVGTPDEAKALTSLTSIILRRYDKKGILDVDTMYCINSVHPCERLMRFLDRPRVLIVHNVHKSAQGNRLVNIRDIMSVFSSTLRFIVVLSDDPEAFVRRQLCMNVDLVLNFGKPT